MNQATARRPVLVVGGGIAGLAAAWELRHRGVPVRLVERTPHLGGRIDTRHEKGGRLESGMQFYYGSYTRTKRLLRATGLIDDLVPIPVRGFIWWEGRIGRFSKTRPWLELLTPIQNLRLQGAFARHLGQLIGAGTFASRRAEPLDQVDVAEYFTRTAGEAVLEVAVRPIVNSYAFREPEGHALPVLLRIIRLGATAGTHGLRQGNDALPRALARALDVVQATAVEILVEQGRVQGVILEEDGKRTEVPASAVICAVGAPEAAQLLGAHPELSRALGSVSYSSVVLANLHLDRPLPGPDWVYVHSRKAGHQAAFAVDLARRVPATFPDGNAVLQVDFVSPVSDALAKASDDQVVRQAIADMEPFLPGVGGWVTSTSVVRRPAAMPSFEVGTYARLREIATLASRLPGLHLAGDWLRAPLCEAAVRSAAGAVRELLGLRAPARPLLSSWLGVS